MWRRTVRFDRFRRYLFTWPPLMSYRKTCSDTATGDTLVRDGVLGVPIVPQGVLPRRTWSVISPELE